MKTAILADTHFGSHQDDPFFLRQLETSLQSLFVEVKKRGIKRVVHLGDLVDRRKHVNYAVADSIRRRFVVPIMDLGIDCTVIVGNHDASYRESNVLNGPDQLLWNTGIQVIEAPEIVQEAVDGSSSLYLPWITPENRQASLDLLEAFKRYPKNRAVYGHLAINGFRMNNQVVCECGEDPILFSDFDKVFSGHFHSRSEEYGINYIGSLCPLTWADKDDEHGFVVYDTETLDEEFLSLDNDVFYQVDYIDGKFCNINGHFVNPSLGFDVFSDDMIVRVVVRNADDRCLLEDNLDQVQRRVHKMTVEDMSDIDTDLSAFSSEFAEGIDSMRSEGRFDTMAAFQQRVSSMGLGDDERFWLESMLESVYQEALQERWSGGVEA